MTTIGLSANDQLLAVTLNPKIASGNQNTVTLHVDFSEDWSRFGKSAVFFTSNDTNTIYEKVLTSGECIVPAEVMSKDGILYIGVRGVNSQNNEVKTTSLVKYKISEGSPSGTGTEVEPTPDVYQQLLTAYGMTDSAIAKEVADRKAEIAVERARIDNLSTLKEGSTTGDAELMDIRVKADGTTSTSAGNAVREQVSELKSDIVCLNKVVDKMDINNGNDNLLIVWEQGTWAKWNEDGKADANNIIRSNKLYYFDEPITCRVTLPTKSGHWLGLKAFSSASAKYSEQISNIKVENTIITLEPHKYYAFYIQNDNGNITPTDGNDVLITIINRYYAVFIGDSYTVGQGLDEESQRFSSVICNRLGLVEKNYGVGGTGFYAGAENNNNFLRQASNAINDTTFRNDDVKYVFVCGGRNDSNIAPNFNYSQIASYVTPLIDGLVTNFRNAKIILIPMLLDFIPMNKSGWQWYKNIIVCLQSYAFPNVHLVKKAYSWLCGMKNCIQSDNVHPNSAGHIRIASNMLLALNGDTNINVKDLAIDKNSEYVSGQDSVGISCDGEYISIQANNITVVNSIPKNEVLYSGTFEGLDIACYPRTDNYFNLLSSNGELYPVKLKYTINTNSYTVELSAYGKTIPEGTYYLFGMIPFGRYLNVATGL